MTYRKSDVQTHSDGFGWERRPAVNVKVDTYDPLYVESRKAALESGATRADADRFVEWISENQESKYQTFNEAFDLACQDGWEQLQTDVEEIFGSGVKVSSEGRSGGWAVVDGLPELEDWDAIMLGKWRRFEKWARAQADDVPYQMASLLYLNVFPSDERKEEWSRRGC